MNKKGVTLIELLIAIVFIGIVLTFLFSLLSDLKGESDNNNYAYDNQVNKIDAIHYIENDLNNYQLLGITDNSSNDSNLNLNIYYDGQISNSNLKIETNNGKTYLKYTDYEGNLNTWEMKDAELNSCGMFTFKQNGSEFYFKLTLFVYNKVYNEQNNKDNNNSIDDIELAFYTKYGSLDNVSILPTVNNDHNKILTYSNITNYNIGKC